MDDPDRRRVYDKLNAGALRSLGSTIKLGPAKGLRFRGGDTAGYILGMSEPTVQRLLVAHLRPGDVYFDVGTHAGFLALLASRLVGDRGAVHCFEPVAGNVRVLEANLSANAIGNATVHQMALADRDGHTMMSIGSKAITAHFDAGGSERVALARLDALPDLPAPHVIKIDVEGAESQVIAGGAALLERHLPVLVIEIHGDQEQPVRSLLREIGYPEPIVLRDGGMPHLVADRRAAS